MTRPVLEVADICRNHGAAWREANAGHVSLGQLKVMSAIESCRTVALGGHVMRCEDCSHTQIAYNSCRNRHCPKCQGAAAKEWLLTSQIQNAELSRRSSTGHGSAHSNARLRSQRGHRSSGLKADSRSHGGPIMRGNVVDQRLKSRRFLPPAAPAASKSP